MAVLAEINRNKKKRKRPFSPKDFNPYLKKDKKKKLMLDIKALKYVFVDKDPKKFAAEVEKAMLKEQRERLDYGR